MKMLADELEVRPQTLITDRIDKITKIADERCRNLDDPVEIVGDGGRNL